MQKAFSLMELMVVVSIIAILSVMAIPAYNSYVNRTKTTQAAEVLQTLNTAAIQTYTEQGAGTTYFYDNVTFTNTVTTFSYPPVVSAVYQGPNILGSPNEWMFCVYVAGLNFSGYVDPTGGSGAYSRMCSRVTQTNGIFATSCGAWDGSSTDIPVAYLPSNCNCSSISTNAC